MSEQRESREQLLRVAEELFSERGYTAVTLKEIADRLGVRQAALYYHMPQGKEQLFMEVTRRSFRRHKAGIEGALAEAEPRLQPQLTAIALWLMSQPPLALTRLARTDLPALSAEHAAEVDTLGRQALIEPLQRVLADAYARGEARRLDEYVTAAAFFAMLDSVHELYRSKGVSREVLARDLVELLGQGMLRR